jgi:hypothetical protein
MTNIANIKQIMIHVRFCLFEASKKIANPEHHILKLPAVRRA